MKKQVFVVGLLFLIIFIKEAIPQQFSESEAMRLFNQGEFQSVIETIPGWINSENPTAAESGLAVYFLGESFYNLGLENKNAREANIQFIKAHKQFFTVIKIPDFQNEYPGDNYQALYKKGWCSFRRAELGENPIAQLNAAYSDFNGLTDKKDAADSLKIFSAYMAGESKLRAGVLQRYEAFYSGIPSHEIINEIINAFSTTSMRKFSFVTSNNLTPPGLKICAQIKQKSLYYEIGKIYQVLPDHVFNDVKDVNKQSTTDQTAAWYFKQANYQAILSRLTENQKATFEPVLNYSEALKYLNMYLISKSQADSSKFTTYLGGLKEPEFERIKPFRKGNFHQANPDLDGEVFINLTLKNRDSYYYQVTSEIPEAYYWLGLVQFIKGLKSSRDNLEKFISLTPEDSRTRTLIYDARLKRNKIDFEMFSESNDQNKLQELAKELESFNPQNYDLKKDKERLHILVRIKLGESIGQIFSELLPTERVKETLKIIKDLLPRAASATGKTRRIYLRQLNKLFEITQFRKSNETSFYRGIAKSLEAEILTSEAQIVETFKAAADTLSKCQARYAWEAKYIMGRNLLLAEKHEDRNRNKEKDIKKAKAIFTELISQKGSLRSLFYLGEIFRITNNGVAAKKCYEKVQQLTQGNADGEFWAINAQEAKAKCSGTGDLAALDNVLLNRVRFPENLLTIGEETISYEKLADREYLQQQFADKSLDLLKKFCLPKKSIYPSVNQLTNSIFRTQHDFERLFANINEIRGPVTANLKLKVLLPQHVVDKTCDVSVGDKKCLLAPDGFYTKLSIPLNSELMIKISNASCYLFLEKHYFTKTRGETKVILLSQKVKYDSRGNVRESEKFYKHSRDIIDRNTIIHQTRTTIGENTDLSDDFISNIRLRDLVFTKNKFLIVDCEANRVWKYNINGIKDGDFKLNFKDSLNSPEGLTLDSDGNIYIADWGNHRVVVFDSTGGFKYSFGEFGINNINNQNKHVKARFVFPTRITIEEDVLGVTETVGNMSIKVFKEKHIFVADRYGVHKFDSQGYYLSTPVPVNKNFAEGSFYGITINGYGKGAELFVVDRNVGEFRMFVGK